MSWTLTDEIKRELRNNWDNAQIRPEKMSSAVWAAKILLKNKSRYEEISREFGIPWWFIGCIHGLECGFNFDSWLANGDPLTGKTVQVPSGLEVQGKNPPYRWEDAAKVSIKYDRMDANKDWSLEGCLFYAEKWNGFGYRNRGKPSQYVWSFTTIEQAGRFVADGKWDPSVWSNQCGMVAMMKLLMAQGELVFKEETTMNRNSVGWFLAHLLVNPETREIEVGLSPKLKNSDENYPYTTRIKLPKEEVEMFLSKFPDARSIVVAEPTKKWPGDLTEKPASSINFPLKKGDMGVLVEQMQRELNKRIFAGLTVDGDFGSVTEDAVIEVARRGGYPKDGVMTEKLWEYLVSIEVSNMGNKKLFDFYSNSSNYQKVYNDVMNWYGTTSNGCVAFMSTALRMVGVDIPKHKMVDGEDASLVTLPFSKHLERNLGWRRIVKASDLLPGDVILTQENNDPGYPAHTYMFVGWKDAAKGTGLVIDNQAFTHERNIFGYGDYNFTPFAYGLRASEG